MEHIRREIRPKFSNLPGAVLTYLILLPEYPEIALLKEKSISWVSREVSEEFRKLWTVVRSIHAFIQNTFIEGLLCISDLILFNKEFP